MILGKSNHLPIISVVMSVYNECETELRSSIESILNQTYPNIEFIIVNDNPENKEVEKIISLYSKENDNIIIIKNTKNIGLAMSLNKGIALAHGDLIARMDADDISELTRLEKEYEILVSNHLDMVTARNDSINEKGVKLGSREQMPTNCKAINKVLPLANFVCHPLVLMKKDVINKIGLYRFFKVSQDYDLWLRMLSGGYKIGTTNEVLLHYRVRENSLSANNTIRRIVYSEYQKQLYRERKKYDHDSYSVESLKKLNSVIDEYLSNDKLLTNVDRLQMAIKNKKGSLFIKAVVCILMLRKKYISSWAIDLIKYKLLKMKYHV